MSQIPQSLSASATNAAEVLGNVPDEVRLRCNAANGAVVNVPQVAWRDNATLPNLLERRLIVNPGTDDEDVYCTAAGCEAIPDQLYQRGWLAAHFAISSDRPVRWYRYFRFAVEVQDDTGLLLPPIFRSQGGLM